MMKEWGWGCLVRAPEASEWSSREGRGSSFRRIKIAIRLLGESPFWPHWPNGKSKLMGRMETLNGLIGKIPSNPLWADLLSSMTKDKHDRTVAARSVSRSTTHTHTTSASGPGMIPNRMSSTSAASAGTKRESSQAMGKTRSAPVQVQVQLGVEGGRTMTGRKGEGVV